jgi:hypothetical protein
VADIDRSRETVPPAEPEPDERDSDTCALAAVPNSAAKITIRKRFKPVK